MMTSRWWIGALAAALGEQPMAIGGRAVDVETLQEIELDAEPEMVLEDLAEDIPLDIIYEDDAILIINKPAGLVVHPAPGHWSGTLLNGLLAHHAAASSLPRAGIVHRLDKDTSGLLVVAKTDRAHEGLAKQFEARVEGRRARGE